MEGQSLLTDVIIYWMDGEINNFIIVWLSASLSLFYCYIVSKAVPAGAARLAAVLPVVGLFLFLPLQLHSLHFNAPTSFFLTWLATFKLLMLAAAVGPLSDPNLSLTKFIALACLPINLKPLTIGKINHKSGVNYAIKIALLALIIKGYGYVDFLHSKVVLAMYSLHIYILLELILAAATAAARFLLGAELEPLFDEPCLSSSLQDFWGRRWNLAVTRVLRPAVYVPVLNCASAIVERRWAMVPAVMATFAVSGVMHELIFFYMGREPPTWEVTGFFLLHGGCLVAEIGVKRMVTDRWRLPGAARTILTVGFVFVTATWLFFPPFLRVEPEQRGLAEIAAVGAFVKDLWRALNLEITSWKLPFY